MVYSPISVYDVGGYQGKGLDHLQTNRAIASLEKGVGHYINGLKRDNVDLGFKMLT